MGLIDFFRQLAAARQGNTQNPYTNGVPSVVNNAVNPTTKANMSVTDPSDPTSIAQGANGPVAQVSQDATTEIPPASPKGPSIPSKILSVIGGLSGLAGKVGEAMQDNGIGEGLNEQQFEARQARALQRRSLDQQQQAQQAAQMRDYVNTMSEVQARTAGTAHAQAEEKFQQDQLQAQKEATLASVLGKTTQGGKANINGQDVDIPGEAQSLATQAPYNAKPFATPSGGLVSVIPGPNGATATPVMNAAPKAPAPEPDAAPTPDNGIPPIVRNGAGLSPSNAPTPTDAMNAPGTPFQGLAKTARFSPLVDKQSGLTYALMDEFTKQPYSVDGKTPLSPADLAQAQLSAHDKHRAEHLQDEDYVTRRQMNMLNAHDAEQQKMFNFKQDNRAPSADELRRADLGRNVNQNLDELEEIIKRRPDLIGPLGGAIMRHNPYDNDVKSLNLLQHQIGTASIGMHAMRNFQGAIDMGKVTSALDGTPQAALNAISIARRSAATFQQDVGANPGSQITSGAEQAQNRRNRNKAYHGGPPGGVPNANPAPSNEATPTHIWTPQGLQPVGGNQ